MHSLHRSVSAGACRTFEAGWCSTAGASPKTQRRRRTRQKSHARLAIVDCRLLRVELGRPSFSGLQLLLVVSASETTDTGDEAS